MRDATTSVLHFDDSVAAFVCARSHMDLVLLGISNLQGLRRVDEQVDEDLGQLDLVALDDRGAREFFDQPGTGADLTAGENGSGRQYLWNGEPHGRVSVTSGNDA